MKKTVLLVLMVSLIVGLSGCELWLNSSYYSERPHFDDSSVSLSTDIEVSSYAQLRDQLLNMVSGGTESCLIYYTGLDGAKMDHYLTTVIQYITASTPIGAYAVESITYENGTSTGKQAVEVTATYFHGRSELQAVRNVDTMEQFCRIIDQSLQNCDAGVVICVEQYRELDIQQYVQDFMDQNPDICMELPQVTATAYPDHGNQRLVEIIFSYQNSRQDLRRMQQNVALIFNSAELYVSGDADNWEKYFQLFSFLMERHNYTIQTSLTPTYHLLRHGEGDSKAFATVYAAMCRRAGLDCQVVTGTKDGQSLYWNVIFHDGKHYFIDLLACNAAGALLPKTQEQMVGYVWDYSLYQNQ